MKSSKIIGDYETTCCNNELLAERTALIVSGLKWIILGTVAGLLVNALSHDGGSYHVIAFWPVFFGLIRLIGGIFKLAK